jgi:NACalpha-BTF3-like transcription factor
LVLPGGEYHGCRFWANGMIAIIIRHLKKAMNTVGINPKEVNQLEKIKAKFSSDSELLFNKINVAIPISEFFAVHIK